MKLLDKINESKNKLAKGFIAIFAIKLLLFGGAFIIQSCQNDDDIFVESEHKLALKKFESLAKQTLPKVREVAERQKLNISRKSYKFKGIQNKDEQEAKEALSPLIRESKGLLLSYGFTENEIISEFGNIVARRAIIRAAGKAAARLGLGFIGVTWAVCMWGSHTKEQETIDFIDDGNDEREY